MMEETFLVNIVKEKMCYVSLDFIEDMHETKCGLRHTTHTHHTHHTRHTPPHCGRVWLVVESRRPNNRIVQKYLLPDYTTTDRGHVLSEDEANQRQAARKAESAAATAEKDQMALDEQVLVMNNERIAVPEILFHPSDIGVPQAGVAETIAQSIACAPRELQSWLYANIVLTGGNTLFPNYPQRLYANHSTLFLSRSRSLRAPFVHRVLFPLAPTPWSSLRRYTELRKLAPTDYPVRVFYPKEYALHTAHAFWCRACGGGGAFELTCRVVCVVCAVPSVRRGVALR
jgi:actin-related protein